jgi:hypothetical protein
LAEWVPQQQLPFVVPKSQKCSWNGYFAASLREMKIQKAESKGKGMSEQEKESGMLLNRIYVANAPSPNMIPFAD